MLNIDLEKIDFFINNKFTSSFMSDSKWDKLIQKLTDDLNEIHLYYKLIYGDKVQFTSFTKPDFKPFFIEPIYYKEVEWIEFPKYYKLTLNKKESKKYITTEHQNIELIENTINSIGKFEYEISENSIRIYGYK